MSDAQKTYPKIPTHMWWVLRSQFKKSFPKKITIPYLSSVLGGKDASLRNWIPHFRMVGLIDNDGNTTDLANRWRYNDDYASVCEEIKESVYPSELRDIDSSPDIDYAKVKKWFAKSLSIGDGAARQMASFYGLLCKADPVEEEKHLHTKNIKVTKGSSRPVKKTIDRKIDDKKNIKSIQSPKEIDIAKTSFAANIPSIHIDIQIHISPEANKDQIENIFESMSKHLNLKQNL